MSQFAVGTKARVTPAFAIASVADNPGVGQTVEVRGEDGSYILGVFITGPWSKNHYLRGDHAWHFLPEELEPLE